MAALIQLAFSRFDQAGRYRQWIPSEIDISSMGQAICICENEVDEKKLFAEAHNYSSL